MKGKIEVVSVLGFEVTCFGASGVQKAKYVTSQTDKLLHWANLAETWSLCLI